MNKIEDFFKPDIYNILKDKKNWRAGKEYRCYPSELICAYCFKKIEDRSIPNYFLIWS